MIPDMFTVCHFPDWTMGYEPISATMARDVPGYEMTFADTEDDAAGPPHLFGS